LLIEVRVYRWVTISRLFPHLHSLHVQSFLSFAFLPEEFAVESAVINGFHHMIMMSLDPLGIFKVGNLARHFEKALVAGPRQLELVDRGFE
jgi:hypothetical protein